MIIFAKRNYIKKNSMASLITGQVDLLSLPDVILKEMTDADGEKQEYVCVPIKKAGLQRFRTKIYLPIVFLPKRYPEANKTHYVLPNWNIDFVRENNYWDKKPELGSGKIKFMYYEQSDPEPFKLSEVGVDNE